MPVVRHGRAVPGAIMASSPRRIMPPVTQTLYNRKKGEQSMNRTPPTIASARYCAKVRSGVVATRRRCSMWTAAATPNGPRRSAAMSQRLARQPRLIASARTATAETVQTRRMVFRVSFITVSPRTGARHNRFQDPGTRRELILDCRTLFRQSNREICKRSARSC